MHEGIDLLGLAPSEEDHKANVVGQIFDGTAHILPGRQRDGTFQRNSLTGVAPNGIRCLPPEDQFVPAEAVGFESLEECRAQQG